MRRLTIVCTLDRDRRTMASAPIAGGVLSGIPRSRVASVKMDCLCGCGSSVKRGRCYVNKEHQLEHMVAGRAREIGALQPLEAKQLGGRVAGRQAALSGRLLVAGEKGAARSRDIAARWRKGQG